MVPNYHMEIIVRTLSDGTVVITEIWYTFPGCEKRTVTYSTGRKLWESAEDWSAPA